MRRESSLTEEKGSAKAERQQQAYKSEGQKAKPTRPAAIRAWKDGEPCSGEDASGFYSGCNEKLLEGLKWE